ncbi:hypothetical protein RND81_01G026200 [Saponaria officinalis]|uniref:Uncharacterized protein n=1 Tax=Saponaria officinalis TaxID=3572 RepID=A0AAW1N8E4_SAPOF
MVSTEVLNPSAVIDLQAEVQITCEPKLLDEICETNPRFQPDLAPISAAHQVFDEMPIPNFILEMAQSAKITQAHNTLHEIGEPESSISEEVPPISDACHMFDDLSTAKMEFFYLPSSESMEFLHLPSSEFMENLRVTSAQPFLDAMREPDYKSNTESRTLGIKSMIQGALNQVADQTPVSFDKIKTELFICGKVMEFKGLASTLKFGSFSSYVFISYIEVLSHIYEVEEHDRTMLYELRNGWKRIVNYNEILSWGKLIVPLAFWNQLANVIELPSFQNDFTCRWIFGKTLYDLVQSYLGRPLMGV